jgi:copper oxidase (laccase) domain-containing protein
LVHAGWRGTAQAITQEAIHQLVHHAGASVDQLIGVVGPSIGACCYEVSQEVVDAVKETLPDHKHESLLRPNPDPAKPNNPYVDLKWANAQQMQDAGLLPDNIEVMSLCTQCEPETLWSYRRGENGRQAAIMMLL